MAGGDDLLKVPYPDGEGERSVAQHRVGAVVWPLDGQDDSTAATPDQGGTQEVHRELVQQLLARIVFARQRKCRSMYDFGKFVNYLIHRKFFSLQKLVTGTR
jgi:hypothetical protein